MLPYWIPCGSPLLGGISWFRMGSICLYVLWIGCGCLGVIRTSSSEGMPRVARSCPQSDLLWPSGSISRKQKGILFGSSLRETAAFKADVRPDRAILGIGRSIVTSSGCVSLAINRDDQAEVALMRGCNILRWRSSHDLLRRNMWDLGISL